MSNKQSALELRVVLAFGLAWALCRALPVAELPALVSEASAMKYYQNLCRLT